MVTTAYAFTKEELFSFAFWNREKIHIFEKQQQKKSLYLNI